MAPRIADDREAGELVRLLGEFLSTHVAFRRIFERHAIESIPFDSIRELVGDDEGSPLYRLKERSHRLFRGDGLESALARSELLFDLLVGSLFHESMKLRESLYQQEFYVPRLAELHASVGAEEDELITEFEQVLDKNAAHLGDGVTEVRLLLDQTLDQLRRLLVERADESAVTRCLLSRRAQVDLVFPEGFKELLAAMHGNLADGLLVAARALIDSAYFAEARTTLNEASCAAPTSLPEIDALDRYAQGMQAFLTGDYPESLSALESWVALDGHKHETAFAQRAAAALGRLGRLVESGAEGTALVDAAKRLVLRLEAAPA